MRKASEEHHRNEKRMLEFNNILSYEDMMRHLDILYNRYPEIEIVNIGHSIFNRNIPMVCLGSGKKTVIYLGAMSGTDIMCSALLLRFINEYCEIHRTGCSVYNFSLDYFEKHRRICIVPMLNPDGSNYVTQGIDAQNPFYNRLLNINGGNIDFSQWKGNGRGVDLRHNFSTPMEPEPETSALEGILRFDCNIKLLIEFGCGNNRVSYASQINKETSKDLARLLGRISGFALGEESISISDGSLLDFCSKECNIPAYSVFCGNTNRCADSSMNFFRAYASIRELLFIAPTMI